MNSNVGRDIALIGIRLYDDAYMAWIAAEVQAEQALRAWHEGGGEQSRAAYHAYRAAVDREEAAARDLERLHEVTSGWLEALVVANSSSDRADAGRWAGPPEAANAGG
jgi:hypothetical protein